MVHIAHDWPNISKALMHTPCQNVEVTRRFGKKRLVPESGLKSQKMMYFVDEFPAQRTYYTYVHIHLYCNL